MKKNLALLSLTTFGYYIVVGLALSIFSIVLSKNNVNEFLIGLSDSIRRCSGIAFMFFVPLLVNRFGLYKISVVSILFYTITLLLMPFYVNYALWIFYIVIFGAGMMAFMTFIDSTLNVMVNDDNRSKINGLLNTVVLGGIAAAPVLFKMTNANIYIVFAICSLLGFLNIFVYHKLKVEYQNVEFSKYLNIFDFVKTLPNVFFSKIFLEFFGTSLFIFTTIYANGFGYSYENASLLLSLYCFSGLVCSYFTGILFNAVKNKNRLLTLGTLLTIILLSTIPLFIEYPIILSLVYFFMGITTGVIHLGCLILVNETYTKEKLVSANSTLSIIGGTAMIFAGPITGIAMDKFNSLILPSALLGGIYILAIIIIKFRHYR